MLDIAHNAKTDKQILELCIPAYLLLCALANLPKDKGESVHPERLKFLKRLSIQPLDGLDKKRLKFITESLPKLAKATLTQTNPPCQTYKECCLATALFIMYLVEQGKIMDLRSQTVLMSVSIVEESLQHNDWGDLKRARDGREKIVQNLKLCGFY